MKIFGSPFAHGGSSTLSIVLPEPCRVPKSYPFTFTRNSGRLKNSEVSSRTSVIFIREAEFHAFSIGQIQFLARVISQHPREDRVLCQIIVGPASHRVDEHQIVEV